jgi:hypothetical protein
MQNAGSGQFVSSAWTGCWSSGKATWIWILRVYVEHYNQHRPHQVLRLEPPDPACPRIIAEDHQPKCTAVTCSAVCSTNTDELHERIYAPYGPASRVPASCMNAFTHPTGPLVPAFRAVRPRRRGAARPAGCRGESRHGRPLDGGLHCCCWHARWCASTGVRIRGAKRRPRSRPGGCWRPADCRGRAGNLRSNARTQR